MRQASLFSRLHTMAAICRSRSICASISAAVFLAAGLAGGVAFSLRRSEEEEEPCGGAGVGGAFAVGGGG